MKYILLIVLFFFSCSLNSQLQEDILINGNWQSGKPSYYTAESLFLDDESIPAEQKTLKNGEILLDFSFVGEGIAHFILVNEKQEITRENFSKAQAILRGSIVFSEQEKSFSQIVRNLNPRQNYIVYTYIEDISQSWREVEIHFYLPPFDWAKIRPEIIWKDEKLYLSINSFYAGTLSWSVYDEIPLNASLWQWQTGQDSLYHNSINLEGELSQNQIDLNVDFSQFEKWNEKEKDLYLSLIFFNNNQSSSLWLETLPKFEGAGIPSESIPLYPLFPAETQPSFIVKETSLIGNIQKNKEYILESKIKIEYDGLYLNSIWLEDDKGESYFLDSTDSDQKEWRGRHIFRWHGVLKDKDHTFSIHGLTYPWFKLPLETIKYIQKPPNPVNEVFLYSSLEAPMSLEDGFTEKYAEYVYSASREGWVLKILKTYSDRYLFKSSVLYDRPFGKNIVFYLRGSSPNGSVSINVRNKTGGYLAYNLKELRLNESVDQKLAAMRSNQYNGFIVLPEWTKIIIDIDDYSRKGGVWEKGKMSLEFKLEKNTPYELFMSGFYWE